MTRGVEGQLTSLLLSHYIRRIEEKLTSVGGGACGGEERRIEEVVCPDTYLIHAIEIVWPHKPFVRESSNGSKFKGRQNRTPTGSPLR